MDAKRRSDPMPVKNATTMDRKSDRELVFSRTFDAPRHLVFEAWTTSELFKRWWVPKSFPITLITCEVDARVGGRYRLVMSHPSAPQPMEFFGKYVEVV